ncbi:MAG: hypothetical protein U1D30_19620 [Planctomycetota bacterium]
MTGYNEYRKAFWDYLRLAFGFIAEDNPDANERAWLSEKGIVRVVRVDTLKYHPQDDEDKWVCTVEVNPPGVMMRDGINRELRKRGLPELVHAFTDADIRVNILCTPGELLPLAPWLSQAVVAVDGGQPIPAFPVDATEVYTDGRPMMTHAAAQAFCHAVPFETARLLMLS